jgi:hypothetical protein
MTKDQKDEIRALIREVLGEGAVNQRPFGNRQRDTIAILAESQAEFDALVAAESARAPILNVPV